MDGRIEVLELMATTLAGQILNPNCKDQNERAQKRQDCHELLIKVIAAIAHTALAADEFSDLLSDLQRINNANASQEPKDCK